MKGSLNISIYEKNFAVETTVFPGGEVKVNLNPNDLQELGEHEYAVIEAQLMDSEMVMALLMLVDAIRQVNPSIILSLELNYVPYARQDRVCVEGESLSIKVFADMINNLNFANVLIMDPHSDVTPALLNNCYVNRQAWLAMVQQAIGCYGEDQVVLVAPDYGATKRVEKLAIELGVPFVQGVKHRDLATGQLSGFDLIAKPEYVNGKHLIIIDDICDGGGTFIGLADVIKEKFTPKSLDLFVTHGIFSGGLKRFNDFFDTIFTSESALLMDNIEDIPDYNGKFVLFANPKTEFGKHLSGLDNTFIIVQ